jgi:hypothetical protein
MSVTIPFVQSDNNYSLATQIDGVPYVFQTYWNARDSAWYFDMYDGVQNPIALGCKVVLGVHIGRRSSGTFFDTHTLYAVDTSNQGLDASFDDLGGRVQVVCTTYSLPVTS